MSDVKITDLPAASSASNDDVLILVDVDADVTKKISKQNLLAGLSGGSSNIDSATVLSIVTAGDLDMSGNKVLFGNVYPTLGDLPSASSYHGMFAHVHATGGAYFAHAGNWVQLTSLQNIVDSADGVAVSGELKIGDMVISSDGNASGNTVLHADSAGNVGIAVPEASAIVSQLEVRGTGITTTHLETTQSVVFNSLPTSDPANAGQLWNDSGTLKISAG